MSNKSGFVSFLYGNAVGRLMLKVIMGLHMDRIATKFLWSSLSHPVIGWYAGKNNIPLTKEEKEGFKTFRDFFVRTRETEGIDKTQSHFISPCDGWLSAFNITDDSCFDIKNSHYRVSDFLKDEELAANYKDGLLLVFRLCASDYHHYCYIDDGY